MEKIRGTSFKPFVSLLAAALLILGTLGPAGADAKSKKKTAPAGSWLGMATYTSPPDFGGEAGGIEFKTLITVVAERKRGVVRIAAVYATVRTYCPGPSVHDIRLIEALEHGPRVGTGGDFSVTVKGVTISGHLGGSRASGHIRASSQGCTLRGGSWEASKRKF